MSEASSYGARTMTCPNGRPADSDPIRDSSDEDLRAYLASHSSPPRDRMGKAFYDAAKAELERRGKKADVKPRQNLKSATLNRDGPSRSTTGPDAEEMETARFLAGVEDCLPWCEACRGLGEYRQGPNRELRPCGYCSAIKRHP